ncbi:hypothetical protein HK099_008233 [Clydaea vesicula]|uniref:DEK-C domain-containing protein n=1 Tax=Clydaea vesicula TaxID=447962 RepID=A0AAD5XXN7_9FUNG|nr:hypothetical protein HK099_008233 [Clydaea vesicula]
MEQPAEVTEVFANEIEQNIESCSSLLPIKRKPGRPKIILDLKNEKNITPASVITESSTPQEEKKLAGRGKKSFQNSNLVINMVQSEIVPISGSKRARTSVQRLEYDDFRKNITLFSNGIGTSFRDIKQICKNIQEEKFEKVFKSLYTTLFGGKVSQKNFRSDLLKFNGIDQEKNDKDVNSILTKLRSWTFANLKLLCKALSIDKSGESEKYDVDTSDEEFFAGVHSSHSDQNLNNLKLTGYDLFLKEKLIMDPMEITAPVKEDNLYLWNLLTADEKAEFEAKVSSLKKRPGRPRLKEQIDPINISTVTNEKPPTTNSPSRRISIRIKTTPNYVLPELENANANSFSGKSKSLNEIHETVDNSEHKQEKCEFIAKQTPSTYAPLRNSPFLLNEKEENVNDGSPQGSKSQSTLSVSQSVTPSKRSVRARTVSKNIPFYYEPDEEEEDEFENNFENSPKKKQIKMDEKTNQKNFLSSSIQKEEHFRRRKLSYHNLFPDDDEIVEAIHFLLVNDDLCNLSINSVCYKLESIFKYEMKLKKPFIRDSVDYFLVNG